MRVARAAREPVRARGAAAGALHGGVRGDCAARGAGQRGGRVGRVLRALDAQRRQHLPRQSKRRRLLYELPNLQYVRVRLRNVHIFCFFEHFNHNLWHLRPAL